MIKTRIAVVDDQQLFRKGLISLISEFKEMDVTIEAGNGKELIDKLARKTPDVVLLDLEMPEMDGAATLGWLKANHPRIRVVILTMHNEESIIAHMIENGAHGFLLKDDPIETLIDAVHSVMDTGYYFDDRVSKALVTRLITSERIHPKYNRVALTERELQIIQLICQEFTNKEIAEKLCLSVRTIDGHRETILEKIKARNTVGIVMYAVKNGLV